MRFWFRVLTSNSGTGSPLPLEQVVPTKISPERVQCVPGHGIRLGPAGLGSCWGSAEPTAPLCPEQAGLLPALSSLCLSCKGGGSSLDIPSGQLLSPAPGEILHNPLEGKTPDSACSVSLHRSRTEIRAPFSTHSCLKSLMVLIHNFSPMDSQEATALCVKHIGRFNSASVLFSLRRGEGSRSCKDKNVTKNYWSAKWR